MSLLDKAISLYHVRKSWLGDGGKPVVPELAQKRADVCLKCPNNQEKPIFELFAGPVAKLVIRQLKLKDEMRLRVRQEDCLHVCSVCGCILKLKIHVPLQSILESGNLDGLPSFCWQITESKTQNQNSHDNENQRIQEQ